MVSKMIKMEEEGAQKRAKGGRIHGAKSKGSPGKRARGGAESNPFSAARHVSDPGFVSNQAGNSEGGKGADNPGKTG
jgi:hypothetical protein